MCNNLTNMCHTAGHCVGLLSWSHSCSGWRQRTQLHSQLCHSLRYHAQRYKLIFKTCFACTHASVTVFLFMPGDDDGHLLMDSKTGEVRLIRAITDSLTTPVLELKVMVSVTSSVSVGMKDFILTALSYFLCVSCNQVYQDDDPRKYSVATVLIRVLSVNEFYPEFDRDEYQGFLIAGKNLASLVITYGNKALMLRVKDRDFNHVCAHNDIYKPQRKHAESSPIVV